LLIKLLINSLLFNLITSITSSGGAEVSWNRRERLNYRQTKKVDLLSK